MQKRMNFSFFARFLLSNANLFGRTENSPYLSATFFDNIETGE